MILLSTKSKCQVTGRLQPSQIFMNWICATTLFCLCVYAQVCRAQEDSISIHDSMSIHIVIRDPRPAILVESLKQRIYRTIHRISGSVNRSEINDSVWILAWQQRRRRNLRPEDRGIITEQSEFYWILFAARYQNERSDKRYAIGLTTGYVSPFTTPPIISDSIRWYFTSVTISTLANDSIDSDPLARRRRPPANISFFESDLRRLQSDDVRAFLGRAFGATDVPFDFFSTDLYHSYTSGAFEYIHGAIMTNTWRELFNEQAPEIRSGTGR